MKSFTTKVVLALALSMVMSVMALAGVKKDQVTFSRDTTVNGTVVKKGQYKVTYDDQTNELVIWQNKTAIAKATVRTGESTKKPSSTTLGLTTKDNQYVLTNITLSGQDKTLVLENSDNKGVPPLPALPALGLTALNSLN